MPELTPEELALIEAGASVDESDAIDDATEEVDELQTEVRALATASETRHTELSERISQCLSTLEQLSLGNQAENPFLTQLSNQIIELRTELSTIRSSVDTITRNPPLNVSPEVIVEQNPEEMLTEVSPNGEVENPVPQTRRKNRFL